MLQAKTLRMSRLSSLIALALSASVSLGADPTPQTPPTQPQPAPQPQQAGQPQPQPAAQPAPTGIECERKPLAPITWTDADIEKVSKLLIGKWKATTPGSDGKDVEVGMMIERVRSADMPDLLYVEMGRTDSLQAPFRQAFYQVYRFKDGLRLRTYELAKQSGGAMVGMWANPDHFPPVSRADLIATIDIDLKPDGDGYSGKSPYPFPTGRGNAVEMTSEAKIKPGELFIADRGYNGKGELVWGAKEETAVKFSPFDPPIDTWTTPGGVFVMEYRRSNDALICKEDDQISVHYLGFLSNGFRFDSSLDKTPPNPLTMLVNDKQLIPGFVQALVGSNIGTVRRVYIPWEQAYKGVGNGRARIPPCADLYFDFEVMHLERPTGPRRAIPQAPPEVPNSAPPQPQQAPQPAQPAPK